MKRLHERKGLPISESIGDKGLYAQIEVVQVQDCSKTKEAGAGGSSKA